MNGWPSTPSGEGSIVVTDFGVGIHRNGIYTPTEIINKGKMLKPQLGEFVPKAFPLPEEGLSQFVWTRWDRFGHKSAQEMSVRSRLLSLTNYSHTDYYSDYSGLKKPYADAYDMYIPLKHRMFALSRITKRATHHGRRLLDLGCAGGLHLLGLANHGIIPFGLEINPWFFRDIHPLLKDNVMFGDAMMDTYLFSDDSFDIIICSAHGHCAYSELPQLFSEISRMTIKGGVLILDLPQAPITIGPNLSPDFRSYQRLLKNAGFKILQLVQKQAVCMLVEKAKWSGASI